MERRTVKGWMHYLEAPDAQLTLSEFMALCLAHVRENVKDGRMAAQHTEGMLETLDEALWGVLPGYARIAQRRGAPVPALPGSGDDDGDM